jgi:hypothetical protein
VISDYLTRLTEYLPQIRKAITAGVTAATALYGGAQLSGGAVSGLEWLALVAVGVGAGLVAWAMPNAENPPVG